VLLKRFCRPYAAYRPTFDCKTRTGKSACATQPGHRGSMPLDLRTGGKAGPVRNWIRALAASASRGFARLQPKSLRSFETRTARARQDLRRGKI